MNQGLASISLDQSLFERVLMKNIFFQASADSPTCKRAWAADLKVPVRMVAAIACSLTLQAAQAQTDYLDQENVVDWASGKYAYISTVSQTQNGEETWFLTVHRDGSRTVRSTNSYNDRMKTFRDVILRVDKSFRPVEAYANVWIDGQWRGSGLFSVTGDLLDAVVNGPNGRLTQTLTVPREFSFVPHPIATDSWPSWYYDKELGGAQKVTLYSFDGRGSGVGGILGQLQTTSIEYIGEEAIETPAGTFICDHFIFGDGDPHLYIFGPHRMLAKMTWKLADVEYVLSEYTGRR
jgi:hypothetical protein